MSTLALEDSAFTTMVKGTKLVRLLEMEGIKNVGGLLKQYVNDTICPSICMNEGCEYTDYHEHDQTTGYCEECHTNTMQSAFILADII